MSLHIGPKKIWPTAIPAYEPTLISKEILDQQHSSAADECFRTHRRRCLAAPWSSALIRGRFAILTVAKLTPRSLVADQEEILLCCHAEYPREGTG
jgi:hypothetical protein